MPADGHLVSRAPGGSPGRRALPPRTLVVLCPDWPATVALATTRGPRAGLALAVVEKGRVVAASPEARAAGVRPGQRRREAESRCPSLVTTARDRSAEAWAFEPVVQVLERFGAPVAVREPGWAGLATRGPSRYFGGEAALVARIGAALGRLDLPGRWWRTGVGDGSFVATQAAALEALVPRGRGAELLAPLAVEVLERPELAEVLRRLGITTLGAFAALGEAEVLARFGLDGSRALRQARGLEEEPLGTRPPRPELSVSTGFDPPAETIEATRFVARALGEQLGERLAELGLACTRLRVEVVMAGGARLSRRWSSEGTVRAPVVAEWLRWQLEAWLGRREPVEAGTGEGAGAEGVRRLELVPEELVPARGRQLDLWSRPRADPERAARAVARVQAIAGPTSVVRGVLVGGRGPGERVRLVAFGDHSPGVPPAGAPRARGARPSARQGDAGQEAPWPGRLPPPNPAVVAVTPLPAELLDASGAPVTVDGRGAMSAAPAGLAVSGAPPLPVVAFAGPWPADERWWQAGRRRRRARAQVLTAGGCAYLLACEGGRWSVEASYD